MLKRRNLFTVGTEAHEMLGRTPGKVKAIKPMKDGVIADYDTTEVMLNYFIKKLMVRVFFLDLEFLFAVLLILHK